MNDIDFLPSKIHGDQVHRILFRAEALLLSWRARHRILRIENRKTKQRLTRNIHKILFCIGKFQEMNILRNF